MALGRLLMVGIAISATACANDTYYGRISTTEHYIQTNSIYDVALNSLKHNANVVPYADRDRHQRCIFFALDSLNVGEVCNWYGNDSKGQVQVVQIEPNTCTTVFNTVTYNKKSKRWQDRACLVGNNWEFFSEER